MKPKNTYYLVILDESGSMRSIERQAVSAMNETFQTVRNAQRDNPDTNYFVSLVFFEGIGTEGVRIIRDRVPAQKVVDIAQEEYRPNSCTPLYDAMGVSISALEKVVVKEDNVVVTIITDGMENSSREYSWKTIRKLVDSKREEGWIFSYIGANQDAVEVANELSIDNALDFEATPLGMRKMASKMYSMADCCLNRPEFVSEMMRKKQNLFDHLKETDED